MRPCSRVIFGAETVPGLCHHLLSVGISLQNWACVCYTLCLSLAGHGCRRMWVGSVFGGCAEVGYTGVCLGPWFSFVAAFPLTFWGMPHHVYLPNVTLPFPHILSSTVIHILSLPRSVSLSLSLCVPVSLFSLFSLSLPSLSLSIALSL